MSELRVDGRYIIGRKLGLPDQQVYEGTDAETGKDVIIKLELISCPIPMLYNEVLMYRLFDKKNLGNSNLFT